MDPMSGRVLFSARRYHHLQQFYRFLAGFGKVDVLKVQLVRKDKGGPALKADGDIERVSLLGK